MTDASEEDKKGKNVKKTVAKKAATKSATKKAVVKKTTAKKATKKTNVEVERVEKRPTGAKKPASRGSACRLALPEPRGRGRSAATETTEIVESGAASLGSELSEKQTRLVEAYKSRFGNVAKACREARVDRSSYYRWLESVPAFRDAIAAVDVVGEIVDLAEEKLVEKLQSGSLPAIFFVLETKGASRGWTKTTNVAVAGPPTVVVQETDVAFFAADALLGVAKGNGKGIEG
ncbi:MAG: hypothetical protein IJ387_01425 [Thermoguttaceae bacterium]|nr:hypothetical protein [Thermoguttaceae bacterium]